MLTGLLVSLSVIVGASVFYAGIRLGVALSSRTPSVSYLIEDERARAYERAIKDLTLFADFQYDAEDHVVYRKVGNNRYKDLCRVESCELIEL